ncbi:hypothetical protein Herbaro_02690 [Herbaspirillum sp. WKF16]|uniref:hypothetical protein n=1 Tax=Herbaspirillum sp. WKF16 TaxID=3028312 RepID=UPI0023A94BB2|nr:hypothetical protein [Herbaspirillum sp. WKF16]WDZ96711.1 hypothetical protein Herbaro_02690 [Herbaspirillum sp. WKF16]
MNSPALSMGRPAETSPREHAGAERQERLDAAADAALDDALGRILPAGKENVPASGAGRFVRQCLRIVRNAVRKQQM